MPNRSTIAGSGANLSVDAQVDKTHQALRTSYRPDDVGDNGGHYSISAQSGLMAAAIASAAQVFQVRWAHADKKFVLMKLTVQAATCTGFAATTIGAPLQLWLGHGSTANGSSGTALAPVGGNKIRAAYSNTAFATSGEIRIATTAALTAATGQTLEAAAIAGCMGAPNATLAQSPVMPLYEVRDLSSGPIELLAGDTLAILTLNPAATGTWTFEVTMAWREQLVY